MFDDRVGAEPPGGVPEWAFSARARLDAAATRRSHPDDGALGRELAALQGGPELSSRLAALVADPDSWDAFDAVDAGSLVELVAAFERTAAWARAGATRAAALLSERPETRPQWPAAAGVVAEQCTASTDLSLRLGITRHAARALVDVGRAFAGPLQQTGAALAVGELDWEKARTLVEALQDLPLAVSVEVEAEVLPVAATLTRPQVARAAQRALQLVDHGDAAERHVRARTRRHVSRPRVLPDGMAAMTAVLPAEAAVRLDACLQSAAVSARRGGDGRTTDQLRADALDLLARSAWERGWIGLPPGPEVPPEAEVGRDGRCVPDGPAREGARADRVTPPSTTGGGEPMRLAQDAGRRTLVSVTVGIGTLLGLDDRPGELAGYGPIGADVARLLATEGTWRRLLVDEPSGALLDVDRRRYRPPIGILEHVRLRNRTCVFPTCSVPSTACQTDHTVPFPQGPTSADNLGPLCTSHHQLKTHGGYRLEQPVPGSFVVRTPSGHVYLEQPERQPGVPVPGEHPSGLVEEPDGTTDPPGPTGVPDASSPGDPPTSPSPAEGRSGRAPRGSRRVWPPPSEEPPPF